MMQIVLVMLIKGVSFKLYKKSLIGTSKNGCKYLSTKPNDDIYDHTVMKIPGMHFRFECFFRISGFCNGINRSS